MNQASFLLKITLITVFHVLKADGNADVPKENALASITEIKVRFMPTIPIMEFNCLTRYNVSESQPICLYYNDELIHFVNSSDQLSHEIEDAKPGEYKCKVGRNEFKFHLPNHMNVLDMNIIEISYYANLVTGQTQVEYESFDSSNTFLCKQGGLDMELTYHDIMVEVESKGYNGILKPKTKTNFKCFINNNKFEFSATNNVEDLYPRINVFQVHILPNPRDRFNRRLHVSCQTRTANNPKIMLFADHYDLMVKKRGNYASFYTHYINQIAFKCIVENEYGRDVISWSSQQNLANYFKNKKDTFTYIVDADRQITQMIYRPARPRNLDDVQCSVKEKNQYYEYSTVQNGNKEKVFTEAIDKNVQYICKLVDNKEFQTEMYTKDWLKVPKIIEVWIVARPHRSQKNKSFVQISCFESVKTINSNFAISLFNDENMMHSRRDVWKGPSEGLRSWNETDKLTKIKCVVENDMGYDMLTAEFKTQVPKNSEIQLKIAIGPNDNNTSTDNITSKTDHKTSADEITSTFDYTRPKGKKGKETTNCKHNNAAEVEKTHFHLVEEDKQNRGEYSCITSAEYCRQMTDPKTCYNVTSNVQFSWTRKLMNKFPDGSLKQRDKNDNFSSFFAFYDTKRMIDSGLEEYRF